MLISAKASLETTRNDGSTPLVRLGDQPNSLPSLRSQLERVRAHTPRLPPSPRPAHDAPHRPSARCLPAQIVASIFGRAEVVEALLEAGAKVSPRDDDGTALDNARKQGGALAGEKEKVISLLEAAAARQGIDEEAEGAASDGSEGPVKSDPFDISA